MTDQAITEIESAPSCRLVRPGYQKEVRWTLAEASQHAGVKVQVISHWLSTGKVKRGYVRGPFRVDASSLFRYLETGKPQGSSK